VYGRRTGIGVSLLSSTTLRAQRGGEPLNTFVEDAAFQNDNQAVTSGDFTFLQSVSGKKSGGSMELHRYDHTSKRRDTYPLSYVLGNNDHFTGPVIVLPSGKVFTAWQLQGDSNGFRWTISQNDATDPVLSFAARQTAGTSAGLCAYGQGFWLSTDGGVTGHVFVFQRMNNTQRGYWVTTIAALETYAAGGAVPTWTSYVITEYTGQRPYWLPVKKNNTEIHFVGNNGNYNELPPPFPIWHGYATYDGTDVLRWYKSDGTEITATKPFQSTEFTTVRDGTTGDIGYYDLAFAADGNPMILNHRFPTGQSANADRVLGISKWSGSAWLTSEYLTGQAPPIPSGDYNQVNGERFDGNDPSIVYVVERTAIGDGGAVTQWALDYTQIGTGTPMTRTRTLVAEQSNVLIFRPVSPAGHPADAPVWLTRQQGWTGFNDFNADLMIAGPIIADTATGLEAETTALIARMTTPPSDRLTAALNAFIRDLKSGYGTGLNVWGKRGAAHLLAAEAADQALLDIAGTGANDAIITGTPTFTAGAGYTGSTGNHVEPAAPTSIPSLAQNSATIILFQGRGPTTTNTNALWGVSTNQLVAGSGPPAFARVNSANNNSLPAADSVAARFLGGTRTAAGTATAFGLIGSASGASTSAAPASDRRRVSNTASKYGQFVWLSQGLSNDEFNLLRFLVQRMMRDVRAVEF
jgi:hypothetical protein